MFTTTLLVLLTLLPPGGTFIDDDGSVHEGGIEAIAAQGITTGCNPPGNTRFCPHRAVTRGQMAAFLARALHLPLDSADRFGDDRGHVFEGAINRIAAAGITVGCNPPANDRFCPDQSMTRGEMAGMLARAFAYPAAPVDRFIDDDGLALEEAINRIAAAGITVGCNPPANDDSAPETRSPGSRWRHSSPEPWDSPRPAPRHERIVSSRWSPERSGEHGRPKRTAWCPTPSTG